jgi:hypothetical protein
VVNKKWPYFLVFKCNKRIIFDNHSKCLLYKLNSTSISSKSYSILACSTSYIDFILLSLLNKFSTLDESNLDLLY